MTPVYRRNPANGKQYQVGSNDFASNRTLKSPDGDTIVDEHSTGMSYIWQLTFEYQSQA